MIYKDFRGEKLSALGMGAMRLPVLDGEASRIDEQTTAAMIACAMEHGVNYYDTAWGYHNGMSEPIMGKLLSAYPRASFNLASKFPGYDLANMDKVQEIFEKQLERCRVDYFDFYLFHNVCALNIDAYLDEKYGIYDYLMAQKKAGRIRHLGFSVHGDIRVTQRFLDAYGDDMEFCQIQLNWLDWKFQNAKAKVELLAKHDIPVWVMEPVRGGKLAALPPEDTAKLRAMRPDETTPGWAFRFLQALPTVGVTLSGMSDLAQMEQNIATMSEHKPLTLKELDALFAIADAMMQKDSLPCTACRYCEPHCPQQLPIPDLIALYNEHLSTPSGAGFIAPMAVAAMPEEKRPSACIGCRSCEAVCPQLIKISEMMKTFSKMVE